MQIKLTFNILLIFLIILVVSCQTTLKNPKKFQRRQPIQNKQPIQKKELIPCWISNKPENCLKYKGKSKENIFVVSKIKHDKIDHKDYLANTKMELAKTLFKKYIHHKCLGEKCHSIVHDVTNNIKKYSTLYDPIQLTGFWTQRFNNKKSKYWALGQINKKVYNKYYSYVMRHPDPMTDNLVMAAIPPSFSNIVPKTKSKEPDFTYVENSSPCWLVSPLDCPEYMKSKDILLTIKIETDRKVDHLTHRDYKEISNKFYSLYRSILLNEINHEIQNNVTECRKRKMLCEGLVSKHFSKESLIDNKNMHKYIDEPYWVSLSESGDSYKWECYVFCLLPRNRHILLKHGIIEQIRSEIPPAYVEQVNPGIQWLP